MKEISDELYEDIKNWFYFRSTTYPVECKKVAFPRVARECGDLLNRLESEETI